MTTSTVGIHHITAIGHARIGVHGMAGTTRGMQDGMETDGTARGITTTSTAGDTHTTVGQDGTHRACITDTLWAMT